jgi:hypothetical protein
MMNADDRCLLYPLSSPLPSQQPGPGSEAKLLLDPIKRDLLELEKLIGSVPATPGEEMDTEAVALVRRAMKARPKFCISLALRALRLEQGLREAQQRVIQLQWELAQVKRSTTALTPAASALDD